MPSGGTIAARVSSAATTPARCSMVEVDNCPWPSMQKINGVNTSRPRLTWVTEKTPFSLLHKNLSLNLFSNSVPRCPRILSPVPLGLVCSTTITRISGRAVMDCKTQSTTAALSVSSLMLWIRSRTPSIINNSGFNASTAARMASRRWSASRGRSCKTVRPWRSLGSLAGMPAWL